MAKRLIDGSNSAVLDFIRGTSAQFVVLGHLLSFYGVMQTHNIVRIQNFGVMIFFVLSGFLITQTTILKGKEYGYKNYLVDRFSRIYSAFLPALLLILLTDYFLRKYGVYNPKYDFSIKTFFGNVFMLQAHPMFRFFGIQTFGSARPFWTVSVEWFIYIFFGIMYYLPFKQMFTKITSLVLLGLSFMMVFYYLGGSQQGLSYFWFLGFASTYIYNEHKLEIKSKLGYFGLLFMLFLGLAFRVYNLKLIELYDLGIAINFTLILLLLLNPSEHLDFILKHQGFRTFSKWLASYSYSLYLVHYTYIEVFKQTLSFNNVYLDILVLFILVNLVSYLFYLLFERRHILFRKALKYILFKKTLKTGVV